MSKFIKCDLCSVEICEPEKCMFAITKRTINGNEYFFCCEAHAKEFERKKKKK
jgi:YHS domain-containing protein